jgi:hypothetical protein
MLAFRWVVAFLAYAGVVALAAVSNPHTSYPTMWIAILLLGVVFYATARSQKRRREAVTLETKGLAALQRGELDKSHEAFAMLAQSRVATFAAAGRHSLAWLATRRGELDDALALLVDTDNHYRRELVALKLAANLACARAFTLALLGRVDDAEAALRLAEDLAEQHAPRPKEAPMRVLTRGVIDCRAGRAEAAVKWLDDHWAECEYTLTGSETRLLRVVRAFALAQSGPREAGVVDATVAQSRPPRFDGEYAFLGAKWPEMATFLTTHGLA